MLLRFHNLLKTSHIGSRCLMKSVRKEWSLPESNALASNIFIKFIAYVSLKFKQVDVGYIRCKMVATSYIIIIFSIWYSLMLNFL